MENGDTGTPSLEEILKMILKYRHKTTNKIERNARNDCSNKDGKVVRISKEKLRVNGHVDERTDGMNEDGRESRQTDRQTYRRRQPEARTD